MSKGSWYASGKERKPGNLLKYTLVVLTGVVFAGVAIFNMLATASTLAVIAVFDAVCIALMHLTGYTREQFAVIHPSGAVGARLQQHVGGSSDSPV